MTPVLLKWEGQCTDDGLYCLPGIMTPFQIMKSASDSFLLSSQKILLTFKLTVRVTQNGNCLVYTIQKKFSFFTDSLELLIMNILKKDHTGMIPY